MTAPKTPTCVNTMRLPLFKHRRDAIGPLPGYVALFVGGILEACTPAATIQPEAPRPLAPIEVTLAVPPASAFDRAVAALIADGYTIDQADRGSGTIKTAGKRGQTVSTGGPGGLFPSTGWGEEFLRVTILPVDSGSRVLLTGSGRSVSVVPSAPGGFVAGPEMQAMECTPQKGDDYKVKVDGRTLTVREVCEIGVAKYREKLEKIASRRDAVFE